MAKRDTTADVMGAVIRLQGMQRKLEEMREERNEAIRSLRGLVTVRELGEFVGLSGAAISRIQTGAK